MITSANPNSYTPSYSMAARQVSSRQRRTMNVVQQAFSQAVPNNFFFYRGPEQNPAQSGNNLYARPENLPKNKFVTTRPLTGIHRHTQQVQDRILSAKGPRPVGQQQTLYGLLTNAATDANKEYDNQRTHVRAIGQENQKPDFNKARATSAAVNRKFKTNGISNEAEIFKQFTTNPSVPIIQQATAQSSNDLNSQKLGLRMNSLGVQDVDRVNILARMNNGGRPPTVRPNSTQNLNFQRKPDGLENYQIGKTIGQGAYAQVRVCLDKRNQRKYAIKIYDKARLQDPMKKKACQREIAVLKRLNHPGVIQLHDLIDSPKQIFMVTDYIKGISLREYVKQLPNRQVRALTARRIFRQVAEAVAYLHEQQGAIHRDVKLDNILIEEGTRMVKLIDFGFSVLTNSQNQRLKVFCGTPSYMAPEITRKTDYEGRPVDMWALGILLYVMLTGAFPFRGVSEQDLYQRIQRGQYKHHELLVGDTPRLIKSMLELDPNKRLKAGDLIREPYILGDDIRMTAFEIAGYLTRTMSGKHFSRETIKFAHNHAVEQLVSVQISIFQRAKKYTQEEIEDCFKQGLQSESRKTSTDVIYDFYRTNVVMQLKNSKADSQIKRQFERIEEIEPEPDCQNFDVK